MIPDSVAMIEVGSFPFPSSTILFRHFSASFWWHWSPFDRPFDRPLFRLRLRWASVWPTIRSKAIVKNRTESQYQKLLLEILFGILTRLQSESHFERGMERKHSTDTTAGQTERDWGLDSTSRKLTENEFPTEKSFSTNKTIDLWHCLVRGLALQALLPMLTLGDHWRRFSS